MKNITEQSIIKRLIKFSPRQLKGEMAAGQVLIKYLKQAGRPYKLQRFVSYIPVGRSELWVDGRLMPSLPTSFYSGVVKGSDSIFNSVTYDGPDRPNINFNPDCPEISLVRFFKQPAVAVRPKDISAIKKARHVVAKVTVKKNTYPSFNILVGNLAKPRNILFCHYDSHFQGAVDNASGTSILTALIINQPELLQDNLFVIAAAEEMSYDKKPAYWGRGYRVFEKKYFKQMKAAKGILVVDGLGYAKPELITQPWQVFEAFPVSLMTEWRKKTVTICGSYKKLLPFYHSRLDDGRQIKASYLDQARKLVLKSLK